MGKWRALRPAGHELLVSVADECVEGCCGKEACWRGRCEETTVCDAGAALRRLFPHYSSTLWMAELGGAVVEPLLKRGTNAIDASPEIGIALKAFGYLLDGVDDGGVVSSAEAVADVCVAEIQEFL